MNSTPTSQSIQTIVEMLNELLPESLNTVDAFVRFLREQEKNSQSLDKAGRFRYPTVLAPTLQLDNLIGFMPPVGGDALKDTEELYNENCD